MIPPVASELIPIERARELVLERVRPLEAEPLGLREALGRVLAADVAAGEDVPGFDNSAMDGYAVRAADTAGASADSPVELPVVDESRAGHPAERGLEAGEAIAISTGAMLPTGADAVVRVEDTERSGECVGLRAEVTPGTSVRRAGEDVRAGDPLLSAGVTLRAAEVGALAAVGLGEVPCARRPRLALLLTGDELVEPGERLGPGQIRDSNAYAVPPLATGAGADVRSIEIAPDDRARTVALLEGALDSDVTVICGGVSVGEHDHVRPALEELGVEQVFWRVSLRPGKPTYFGVAPSGSLVFGLPGNPVSAMVTFLLFARPALLAMQGADPAASRVEATLGAAHDSVPGRAEAIRVWLEAGPGGWVATPTGPQGSHVLTSMIGADGLAFAPSDAERMEAGDAIAVELLSASALA
jgi:molybdopterin molybdotransferase